MSNIDQDPNKSLYQQNGHTDASMDKLLRIASQQATFSLTSANMPEPHLYSPKPPHVKQLKTWIVGGAEYGRCVYCGQVVRLNKPFLGSLHLCS